MDEFSGTPNPPLMDEEEEQLMEAVDYVSPVDEVNNTDDEILLVDADSKEEALEKAEAWTDLVATLDGDAVEIGDHPTLEHVEESVVDWDTEHEVRLLK